MHAVQPLYRVLFVCAGNTCRSPIAAVALVQALGDGAARVAVESAGVIAADGSPASTPAIAAAAASGLVLDGHRSRRVQAPMIDGADLVLALDRVALDAVRRIAPDAEARTFLIGAYEEDGALEPDEEEVPDPFGGSREAYEECVHRIRRHAERMAPEIAREVRARAEAEAASSDRGGA